MKILLYISFSTSQILPKVINVDFLKNDSYHSYVKHWGNCHYRIFILSKIVSLLMRPSCISNTSACKFILFPARLDRQTFDLNLKLVNMKPFLLIILLLINVICYSQQNKEAHVVTHHRVNVMTDPASGEKKFTRWGVFPKADFPIRKIIMHLVLGSPDSLPTAHWDYCDLVNIRRTGGVKNPSLDYEIGRMLTPYGSIFGKGWQWEWDVDVTDFSAFLRDSVEIEYLHTGYEPPSVGWALTLDFEIISGPPVVKPLQITRLWKGKYSYGDTNEKIEDKITPISYETLPGSQISRVRIQHTGHGMDKPKGCSEFCSRWRDIKLDDRVIDHRNMWKDCGNNPLYPQGGTWLYDRAYWCPGDLQIPDIFDIYTKPGTHSLSLTMEPYIADDKAQAVENITAYLIQYSSPLHSNDAAIDAVIVPTNKQQYSRLNPACFHPRIRIRNLGNTNLRYLTITYGTEGYPKNSYSWKGNLGFNCVEELELPGEINEKEGKNNFTVTVSKPNGKKDEWEGDNSITTEFNGPKVLPDKMILLFRTNNHPSDNEICIVNGKTDTVFQKKSSSLKPNSTYLDTLQLVAGKYEFFLTDTAGDGLEFWAEPDNGNGYLRLLDLQGNLIHTFESDCGNGQFVSFIASPDYVSDTTKAQYAFSMFPRLTDDKIDLEVLSNKAGKMTVLITVDAKLYEKHEYTNVKAGTFSYHLGYLPKGRYVVEVLMDGTSQFKGRVNKR
jgi:hypothetical protein